MMVFSVLVSVFLVALLGGWHCATMCGGLILAVEGGRGAESGNADRVRPLRRLSRARLLGEQAVMHLGRISVYSALGAVAGALGAGLWMRGGWVPVQRALFVGAGLLLLGYGLLTAFGTPGRAWRAAWLERPMVWLFAHVPLARLGAWLPREGWIRRYAIGLAWGFLPCGMVYGALALALMAGNAASGAVVMLAFGLGTLPNLLLLSSLAQRWRGWQARRGLRLAAGLAIGGFGLATIWRAWALPQTLAGHGICVVF